MTLDEIDAIRGAVQGDLHAQQQLYDELSPRVYWLVRRIVGPNDAEDVAQDAFLQIFRKLPTFQFHSQLSTWVYKLAVNAALQHLRRSRSHHTMALSDVQVTQTNPAPHSDLKDSMEIALARLEPELRVILQLKEIDQLSYEEIAEIVGIPSGTVGSRLNRARRDLRQQLRQLGWEN